LNDIAILKLKTEANLNEYIQIACLPSSYSTSYPEPNQQTWALGWGTTSEGGFLQFFFL